MKKLMVPFIAGCGLLATANIAQASSVGLTYNSLDVLGASLSGFAIGGSLDMTDNLSIELSTANTNDTIAGVKVKYDATSIGLGYRFEVNETVDLKAYIGNVDHNLTVAYSGYNAALDDNETIYGISLNADVSDTVSLQLGFADSSETDMVTSYGITVEIFDDTSLVVSGSSSDYVDSVAVGVKFDF